MNETLRELWLNYYNEVLRMRGVITEEEYRKMRAMIISAK